jgi:hypothetical protein
VQEHLAAGQGSVTQRRTVEDVQWALEQPEPTSITNATAAAAAASSSSTIAEEQLYGGSSSTSSGCYALSKQWEREFKAFSNKVSHCYDCFFLNTHTIILKCSEQIKSVHRKYMRREYAQAAGAEHVEVIVVVSAAVSQL